MPLISPNVYQALNALNLTPEQRVKFLERFNAECAKLGYEEEAPVPDEVAINVFSRVLPG